MARKSAPGTLIHCDACGEDYSATYKRCPFCGEKPDAWGTAPIPRAPRSASPEPKGRYDDERYDSRYDDHRYDGRYDDSRYDGRQDGRHGEERYDGGEYIFDGGDVFEDGEEYVDEPAPRRSGKRLAQAGAPGQVNWPRMITFICSLVIVAAALIIVFAYIYPKIHDPNKQGSASQPPVSEPPAQPSPALPSPDLSTQDPGADSTDVPDPDGDSTADPSAAPSTDVTPAPAPSPAQPSGGSVTSLSLDKSDITLAYGGHYDFTATVTPSGWDGTVSWSSSNTSLATVDQNGRVTNVNTGDQKYRVTITATAGDKSVTCVVRCNPGSSGGSSSETTPAPQPSQSTSSSSGTLTLNKSDFTLILGDSERGSTRMRATGADSVTWSISNTAVATIDANGRVTAVGAGTATITATAPDGRTATCIARVK